MVPKSKAFGGLIDDYLVWILSFDFLLHIRDKVIQVFVVFLHEIFWES